MSFPGHLTRNPARRVLARFVALWLLTAALCAACAQRRAPSGLVRAAPSTAQLPQLPPSVERKVRLLQSDLLRQGYQVAHGYWALHATDCRELIQRAGTCYGNNPAAPYVVPVLPPWDDEFVEGRSARTEELSRGSVSDRFRLDAREAIVVVGILPPPAAYFGLQTYVFTRQGSFNPADPIYLRLASRPDARALFFARSPGGARAVVFSSIGNSINHVIIERQSGAAFGQERFFILTPDAVMERAMRGALLRAGVPDRSHIFTEAVSTEVVRVGLGPEADELTVLLRYAMPRDGEAAGAPWRGQLPLAILRVRDPNATRATEPYPAPVYDPRTASSELALADDLARLIAAVKQRWGQPSAASRPFLSMASVLDLVGQHCLRRPMNCVGDTQDADYRFTERLRLDAGKVIAVVGTLGTATGNATYVSLAVNRASVGLGVANISHLQLQGTAAAFSSTVNNTDKFYVHYLARACRGISPCLEVPDTLVPPGEPILLMQRNYIRPGSARGPDPAQLLSPWIVVLDSAMLPRGH